jgi:hypothetical protein
MTSLRKQKRFSVKLSAKSLWLFVNHLKSKGYGAGDTSNVRRKAQAAEIANIYKTRHGA